MADKKKLLIVNDLLRGGGVEKLMQDLVWHWHKKYEITILTYDYCQGFGTLYPQDVSYLFRTLPKKEEKPFLERWQRRIIRKLREQWFDRKFRKMSFDLVLAMKDGWIMKEVSRMKIPIRYAWIHTDYRSYYYTYHFYDGPEEERICMQRFKKIVCVSQDVKTGILKVIGDPGNLVVQYNPIAVDSILEKAQEPLVDIKSRPEPGVVRFVTVGRLNYQKGYDVLLEACHMLELEGFSFEVLVIGGEEPWSDEYERLKRAQKRLRVKSVQFLGNRGNPYKYMKSADWFLSTSLFEGYSLVSQEAAVLDVPLLLTDCSGVRELIGDSEYGMVMEISVHGIYNGMKEVMKNPGLHPFYKQKIKERKAIINFEKRVREIDQMLETAD